MRQAVMVSPGKIEFGDVDRPRCLPDQALVRIRRIGICGSDVHVYHGTHPFTGYPVIQGHEFSGEVIEVGSAVENAELSVGRKVTCETQVTCGRCRPCRTGRYHVCDELRVRGFQTPGVAQEVAALPADKLIPLPERFSFDEGALMEPAAVGVHATARAGIDTGAVVVVVGAGPIGMMVALAAKARGASRVLVSELSEARRRMVEQLGIDEVVDPREEPLGQAVRNRLGEAPDVIIECVGTQASLSAVFEAAGKGIRLVAVGVYPEQPRVDMARVVEWELDLVGSMMYRREDWLQAVRWVDEGRMNVAPLVTHHYPFADYLAAYRWLDDHADQAMKVMIDVDR